MQTAQELYKEYNRHLLPAAETVINSGEAFGVPFSRLYFSGEQSGRGITRIYAVLYTAAHVDAPVIVIMPDLHQHIDTLDVSRYISSGYSVLCVDYAGENESRERFTIYPKGLEHCNYFKSPSAISTVPETPAQSCWFTWGTVAHRAVAFLEEKGYSQIALLGMGCGGSQIIKVLPFAGDSVKCGAILFSDSYWGKGVDKSKENYYNFVACLSPAAFAPFVDVPLFIQATSNEAGGGMDKLCEIASNCSAAYFSVSPRTFKSLGENQKDNILTFFDLCLKQSKRITAQLSEASDRIENTKKTLYFDGVPSLAPTIKFKPSVGGLYTEIETFDCTRCELYFCHGSSLISRYRNWHCIKPEIISDTAYLAKPEFYSADEPLHAFANTTLSCGLNISTIAESVIPSALGVQSTQAPVFRLIYEADMGVDDWLIIEDDLNGKPEITEDALGIKGIYSSCQSLATFKLSEEEFAGSRELSLSMTVKARSAISLTVVDKQMVKRVCNKTLTPSDKWQKLVLFPEDFKAEGIPLPSWKDVLSFEVCGDAVINTMLWV